MSGMRGHGSVFVLTGHVFNRSTVKSPEFRKELGIEVWLTKRLAKLAIVDAIKVRARSALWGYEVVVVARMDWLCVHHEDAVGIVMNSQVWLSNVGGDWWPVGTRCG